MNFTVYKSSAGSGKTYTLVKEYLKIALQNSKPDNYRSILAITFTNKATSEMKERIISALKALSSLENLSGTNSFLQNDLTRELKIGSEELREQAGHMLSHILHHYSDFAISTIDKFVLKVVRAFARDLRIPMNFEVELEDEVLLRTAIGQLISKTGTEPLLTRILIEFAEKKAEDEKSWNIEDDLFLFAREMLKEESLEFSSKLNDMDLTKFFRVKDDLFRQVKVFEADIKKIGQDALLLIENAGIQHSAISGGDKGTVKYFSYLSQCRRDKLIPSPTVRKNIGEDKWHSAKSTPADRNKIDSIKNTLIEFYNKAIKYLEINRQDYFLFRIILKNIYSLALLRELDCIIEEIKEEKNIIHISEFNKKIAAIVSKESAPFIYERIGEKYKHFLVDEFQDTSILQWLNLLPLIHNSLSEGNFNMLVGDGKQAIYRWRSGDVDQFARLPQIANPEKDEILEERKQALLANYSPEYLTHNFRSKKEIVEFNNFFFGELAAKLNDNYRSIYHSHAQKFKPENTGGFVNFEIFKEGDFKEKNLTRIHEIILSSEEDNFDLRDICILCRGNSEASEIASFLLEKNIAVISSESLLLNKSPEVNFIISFFGFLENRTNKKFQAAIKIFLFENKFIEGINLHAILSSETPVISLLKEAGYEVDLFQLQRLPLYELAEELIRIFSLNTSANPYIAFFLEQLHSFALTFAIDIPEFLEFWERKKNKASIITPEGINAVRIMTIHKAKGLEFPVVIFPFANWIEDPTRDFLWVDLPRPAGDLKVALVNVNEEMADTVFAENYNQEKNKSLLDNFNILYVAFTRARDRLHVITSIEIRKNFSKRFIDILQKHPGWNEESHTLRSPALLLELPSIPKAIEPGKNSFQSENSDRTYLLKQMISSDWRHKIQISRNSIKYAEAEKQKNYGKLLHYALSFVRSGKDIESALEKLTPEFICDDAEKKELSKKITSLLLNQQIKPFFEEGLNVKTESDILLSNGESYRPDRVVLFENRTVIIDYKTGIPLEKHKDQIENYGEIILQMGYPNIEKYLIYTEEERVVKIH